MLEYARKIPIQKQIPIKIFKSLILLLCLIIVLRKMRSQTEQQFFINPTCPSNHQAVLVCVNQNCEMSAFICSFEHCLCRNHFCQSVSCTKFLANINQQRICITNHQQSIKSILNIYGRLIYLITKKQQQFLTSLQYLGLNDLSKQVAKKINKGQYNDIKGKVIRQIIQQPVKLKSNLLFNSKNHFEQLTQNLQQKLNTMMKQLEKQSETWEQNIDSKIIIPRDQQLLKAYFNSPNIKFKRIYRASQSNFEKMAFRKQCMGIPNILVLIKTNSYKIIGGYLREGWVMNTYNSGNSLQYFEQQIELSDKSFLFSITDKEFYPITGNRKWKKVNIDRILSNIQGPYFGPFSANISKADLYISSRCDKELKSFTNFPSQYGNLQELNLNNMSSNRFCGERFQNHFYVKEYQVYRVSVD